MKCFLFILSALIIVEAKNIPGIEVYELLQDHNGVKIRPISSNANREYKQPKAKPVDSGYKVNTVELMKHILNQISQYESDSAHVQGDIPLEENLFMDETRGVTPQSDILLHLLAKQLGKPKNNFPVKSYKPILRGQSYDRTSAPRHKYRYDNSNE